MKKILLIIIVLFTCTSCFDYEEITDCAIVLGIGITKKNELYNVTFEILNTNEDNSSYTIENEGKNIADAIKNLEDKIAKNTKYTHLKVMIIDNSININDIATYFIHNQSFTNNFYLFYTDDNIKDILSFKNDNEPINSFAIMNLVNETNSNILLDIKDGFDYNVARLKDDKSIVIPNIKLEDVITLDGMIAYKKDKLSFYLDNNDTKMYGLLKKKIKNNLITFEDNAIETINNKINLKYDNKYIYDIFIEAKIKMTNNNNINQLEKEFEIDLQNKINNLINKCYENDTDILDFKKINNSFKNNYLVNIKVNITLK